jgi:hypothetical protein
MFCSAQAFSLLGVVIEDHFADGAAARATIATCAAAARHVVDRAGAILDDVQDLVFGHPLADADDHSAGSLEVDIENDIQFHGPKATAVNSPEVPAFRSATPAYPQVV